MKAVSSDLIRSESWLTYCFAIFRRSELLTQLPFFFFFPYLVICPFRQKNARKTSPLSDDPGLLS
jgi:hypothetical protein